MAKIRHWTKQDLKMAVSNSYSLRQVLKQLGLKQAGGNYDQIKKYIKKYNLDTYHFKGKAWSKGLKIIKIPRIPLDQILVKDSNFQSYKLKNRLIKEGLKLPRCEICGWAEKSPDGRLPLELHHINGDASDNRLENLMILCPNCHSLQSNYRGRKNKKARVAK